MEHLIVETLLKYGYAAIFVLMLLQAACIPIPSEATMVLGGAAASTSFVTATLGTDASPLTLWLVILAGVAGDLAGSWIAYGVGRVGGRPAIERWGQRIFLREHELERAERWFARYGEAAVFISKLLPVVRSFISLAAGVAEMDPARFSLFVVLGSLPFTITFALLGYNFGDEIVRYIRPIAYVVGAIVVLVGIVWFVRSRRRRAREIAAGDGEEPDPLMR